MKRNKKQEIKKVRALYDMETTDGIRWTQGGIYDLEENENDFGIEADNGFPFYVNGAKKAVLIGFKKMVLVEQESFGKAMLMALTLFIGFGFWIAFLIVYIEKL